MSTHRWIRNLLTRAVIRTNRKSSRRTRMAVDALEDRRVPATFTVTNIRDDGSTGTLRWAMGQANSQAGADSIVFDNSVFGPTAQTISLNGTQLELSTDPATTSIFGPNGGVFIDAGGASRVLQITFPAVASMENMTFTGGNAPKGGGILNSGDLNMFNCLVVGNMSNGDGGGLFNDNGDVTLNNCSVGANRAAAGNNNANGGGIANTGNLSMSGSYLSNNTSSTGGYYTGNGGGLWNQGKASFDNCTLSGNMVSNDGGAVLIDSGEVSLTDCTVSGNTAGFIGGGLFVSANQGSTITLTRCTISGNTAGRSGGGLANAGMATLTNCTVSGNTADPQNQNPGEGGGIWQYGVAKLTNCTVSGNSGTNGGGLIIDTVSYVSTTLINTIVSGNTARREAQDIDGSVTSLGHNLIGITEYSSGWISTDLTGTAAQPLNAVLGPLGNNGGPTETMALLRGSPAIKKGTQVPGVTTDQRGLPLNSPPDIGAFQTQVATIPPPAPAFAVGAGPGGAPLVNVYNDTGTLVRVITAYPASFRGGVHVATADVNGDSIADLITAPGFGGGPVVRIWDGETGTLQSEFNAYDPLFRGGANVAVIGLLSALGPPQIITGPGPNGGPHVKVFDSQTQAVLASFLAYDPSFTGGISVTATAATALVPGQIITGAGPGGGPHVRTFTASGAPQGPGFMAFDLAFIGGVNVAALGNSGIITAPASNGAPVVRQFNLSGVMSQQFLAYDAAFFGGVSLGVIPFGSGSAVLTGAGPGGGPHVKAFDSTQFSTPVLSFMAFDPAFTGGVFAG